MNRILTWGTLALVAAGLGICAYGQVLPGDHSEGQALRFDCCAIGPPDGLKHVSVYLDLDCPTRRASLDDLLVSIYNGPIAIRYTIRAIPIIPGSDRVPYEALYAATAQRKYWVMLQYLRAHPSVRDSGQLTAAAIELGLDVARFIEDLGVHRYRKLVDEDRIEALRNGTSSLPTMIVGKMRIDGQLTRARIAAVMSVAVGGGEDLQNWMRDHPVVVNTTNSPRKGDPSASVEIVEFVDLRCGACAQAQALVRRILRDHSEHVRFVVKHYLSPAREGAILFHIAAVAAGAQGKFWQMFDLLFQIRGDANEQSVLATAESLNLDMERFRHDLFDRITRSVVDFDTREGVSFGITWTPAFLVNGRLVPDGAPVSYFERLIETEIAKSKR